MPLYEYECGACGVRFEIIHKFSDQPATVCGTCGQGPVRRLPSAPAIQFKGSGFYINDYARKGESGATPPSESSASGTTGSSGSSDKPGSSESKTDSSASDSKRSSSDSKPSSAESKPSSSENKPASSDSKPASPDRSSKKD